MKSRATAKEDQYAIRVLEPVRIAANLIQPAPYNPKTISPENLDALKLNIQRFGFIEPLVIQDKSSKYGERVLIGGHQRFKAIREIGIESNKSIPDLPCYVLDVDDRTAKKLNVVLTFVKGEVNPKMLGELLEDINHTGPILKEEVLEMGLDQEDYAKYMHLAEPPRVEEVDPQDVRASRLLYSLEFSNVHVRNAVRDKLMERARVAKMTTGDVVHQMLGGKSKKS